jgi:hypothetical protein
MQPNVKQMIASVSILAIVAGVTGAGGVLTRDRIAMPDPAELRAHNEQHKEQARKIAWTGAMNTKRTFDPPPAGKSQTLPPPEVEPAKPESKKRDVPKSPSEAAAVAKLKQAKDFIKEGKNDKSMP